MAFLPNVPSITQGSPSIGFGVWGPSCWTGTQEPLQKRGPKERQFRGTSGERGTGMMVRRTYETMHEGRVNVLLGGSAVLRKYVSKGKN